MVRYLEIQIKKRVICFFGLLLIMFSFSCFGCSYMSKKPENIMLLTSKPMGHTSLKSYLSIDKLYASDTEFYMIASWEGKAESKDHEVRWEIHDSEGRKLYASEREPLTIRSNMYTLDHVLLKEVLPVGSQSSQLTQHFYLDNELVRSKTIQYDNESIAQNDTHQVTILPFVEDSDYPEPWAKRFKDQFQNTVADAIYCEVNRVIPNTIPHYVAEQKVGKHIDKNCYKDPACMSFLKKAFGENIYIFGDLSIQKFGLDSSRLTVHVYDMKTDEIKTFQQFWRIDQSYPILLRDLLSGVLYKEGLLDYLKKM